MSRITREFVKARIRLIRAIDTAAVVTISAAAPIVAGGDFEVRRCGPGAQSFRPKRGPEAVRFMIECGRNEPDRGLPVKHKLMVRGRWGRGRGKIVSSQKCRLRVER